MAAGDRLELRGEDGRVLFVHDIAGTGAARIGPTRGLAASELSSTLDRLAVPFAELKRAHEERTLELLRLPEREDDIVAAEAAFGRLAAGARTILFLGMGGSSLGGQTIAQLSGWNIPGAADAAQKGRPRTRFLDNLDAGTLAGTLATLDLASTRFVVTSKSGGTPETLAQTLAFMQAIEAAGLGARMGELFLGVTEPDPQGRRKGLRALFESRGIPLLNHPTGIGGRYSALTVVGLLPALARGLDVRALRRGARAVVDHVLAATEPAAAAPAVGAALQVALAERRGVDISVLMPYADRLERLGAWYVQLWAESLGKSGKGTTPIACLGPLDQHSQLQLFMDGPPRHLLTILRVAGASAGPRLDPALAAAAGLDVMAGRTIGELVAAQAAALPEALAEARRPVRTIDLPRLDEATLGALMMHFMLETILAGRLLGVDPFDQPAVELAKVLTRERLKGGA